MVPDWTSLINLLPILLVLGVIGPLASLGMLAWGWYFLRKPRAKVRYDENPIAAPLAEDGQPLFPKGLPYSTATALIYQSGRIRGDAGEDLSVICPMCGIGRDAAIDTCGELRPRPEGPAEGPGPCADGAAAGRRRDRLRLPQS